MSALIFLLLFSPACRLPFVKTYFSPKDRVLLVLICCNYTWRWVVRQTAICRLNSDHRHHLLASPPSPTSNSHASSRSEEADRVHTHTFWKGVPPHVTVHSLSSTPRIKCRFIIFQPTHPPVRVTGVCVQGLVICWLNISPTVTGLLWAEHEASWEGSPLSWWHEHWRCCLTKTSSRSSKHWRGRFSPWRNVI